MTKSTSSLSAVIVASALLLSAPTATAQGRGRGQAKKADKVEAKQKHDDKKQKHDDKKQKHDDKKQKHDDKKPRAGDVAIDRDGHARVIRGYVREGSLPPGLAKRESLPPGLAKQLRERGELPPGLQKRLVAVPDDWERRLPPVPAHYRRYFAGDDLVIVDSRTNRIAYLIRDALR